MLFIDRQRRRKALVNIAAGFLIDLAIAAAVLLAIGSDDFLKHLFYIVLGINGIYLLVWLRMQILPWLGYLVSGRKALTAAYLDLFRENGFPKPKPTDRDGSDYLNAVVDDPDSSVDTRVFAGHVLGEMNTFLSMGIVSEYVKINIAIERALRAYRERFADGEEVQQDDPDGVAPVPLEFGQESSARLTG